ncbi:MAG: nitroreductase family protein [Acidimicrobiales bacterium]
MDAYDAILTKRDTRSFSNRPVADDDLRKVLQAGRMAGSAKNQQLNRIVVVTDPGDRAALAGCGRFADWLPACPVVLAIVVPTDGGKAFDIGRMAQNMMVAAQSLGLASCPVTFHDGDCVRDLLGFPDDHEAPMGVGIGHPAPAEEQRKSSPRIPLDELVDRDRWKA